MKWLHALILLGTAAVSLLIWRSHYAWYSGMPNRLITAGPTSPWHNPFSAWDTDDPRPWLERTIPSSSVLDRHTLPVTAPIRHFFAGREREALEAAIDDADESRAAAGALVLGVMLDLWDQDALKERIGVLDRRFPREVVVAQAISLIMRRYWALAPPESETESARRLSEAAADDGGESALAAWMAVAQQLGAGVRFPEAAEAALDPRFNAIGGIVQAMPANPVIDRRALLETLSGVTGSGERDSSFVIDRQALETGLANLDALLGRTDLTAPRSQLREGVGEALKTLPFDEYHRLLTELALPEELEHGEHEVLATIARILERVQRDDHQTGRVSAIEKLCARQERMAALIESWGDDSAELARQMRLDAVSARMRLLGWDPNFVGGDAPKAAKADDQQALEALVAKADLLRTQAASTPVSDGAAQDRSEAARGRIELRGIAIGYTGGMALALGFGAIWFEAVALVNLLFGLPAPLRRPIFRWWDFAWAGALALGYLVAPFLLARSLAGQPLSAHLSGGFGAGWFFAIWIFAALEVVFLFAYFWRRPRPADLPRHERPRYLRQWQWFLGVHVATMALVCLTWTLWCQIPIAASREDVARNRDAPAEPFWLRLQALQQRDDGWFD